MENEEYAKMMLYKIHDALTTEEYNAEEYLNLFIDLMEALNILNTCLDEYNYNRIMLKELKKNKNEFYKLFLFQVFASIVTCGMGIIFLPITLKKLNKLIDKIGLVAENPLNVYKKIIDLAVLKQELLLRKVIKFINSNSSLDLNADDENVRKHVNESLWNILNYINEKEISYADLLEQEIMVTYLRISLKSDSTNLEELLNLFYNNVELYDQNLERTLQ